jgi:hypothetical protein
MAERVGDADGLGRLPENGPVLDALRRDAKRSPGGAGPWSPDGWIMRTHPDLTEALTTAAPDDVRIVLGVTVLVTSGDIVYAVGVGTSGLWLRVPSGPAYDDALGADGVEALAAMPGWVTLRVWRSDLAVWLRASAALSAGMGGRDA